MRIDFLIVRPGPDRYPRLSHPLAKGLQSLGYQAAILTLGVDKDEPDDDVPIFCPDYPARVAQGESWGPAVAHHYGVRNFRRLAYCQYMFVQAEINPAPLERLAAEVPAAFTEVQRLFEEHEIGCVVQQMMGGEILREVAAIVARARGIPVLYNAASAYFENRVLFVRDTRRTPVRRPRVRFAELPTAKRRQLLDYIEAKRKIKPVDRHFVIERRFSGLVKKFVAEKKFKDPMRLRNAFRRLREQAEYLLSKCYWKDIGPEKPYVYFPLQYIKESTIIIGCPKCFRQEAVLELISRHLPSGTELCFKQHPSNPAEGSSFKTIRESARLPNARLLPVTRNSWDISRQARAIITIDNTVGFEALLLGKPVVVLGYPSYRGWGVTRDVTDLNDLGNVLDAALLDGDLDESRLMDFLASFESAHVEGNWFAPPFDPDMLARSFLPFYRQICETP